MKQICLSTTINAPEKHQHHYAHSFDFLQNQLDRIRTILSTQDLQHSLSAIDQLLDQVENKSKNCLLDKQLKKI